MFPIKRHRRGPGVCLNQQFNLFGSSIFWEGVNICFFFWQPCILPLNLKFIIQKINIWGAYLQLPLLYPAFNRGKTYDMRGLFTFQIPCTVETVTDLRWRRTGAYNTSVMVRNGSKRLNSCKNAYQNKLLYTIAKAVFIQLYSLTQPLRAEWHIGPHEVSVTWVVLQGRVVGPALNPQPGRPGCCLVWPLSRRPIQHGWTFQEHKLQLT